MTKLRQYQLEGARAIRDFGGRALLADDQGLGKTIQALYFVHKTSSRRPVVVICPSSVKYNWQAECSLHFGMRAEVIDGHRKPHSKELPGDINIINYDILQHAKQSRSWLPVILKAKPQILIIDEIQFCKNPAAKRTKATLKIAEHSRARIGLSGTPIENNVVDLFPILQAIKPELFPSFTKFAWRYTKPKYTPWGWSYTGSAHSKELNKILLKNLMIRRLKSDVATELPEKIYKTVFLKLPPTAQAEYDKASKDFMGWLRSKSPARANRAKRSQALTRIGYLVRLAAKLKHKSVLQWIKDFHESHPDEKLVGMSMHTPCIESLMRNFAGSVKIDGSVTGKLRHETVRKFQTSPKVKNLWGQWKAAGIGITLTAASNFAALDLPWTPATYKQGPDRIHRIGQTKHCIIHLLIAIGTIEERLIKVLRDKGKIQDSVIDGKDSSEDIDFLEELLKELKK